MRSQPLLHLAECIQFGPISAVKCHRPMSLLVNIGYEGRKSRSCGKTRQQAVKVELIADKDGGDRRVILTFPF